MMMTFQESETVELKKSTSELKEAVISIVAMLNKHQRGEVWFGVRNVGTVVGQQVSEKTIRDIYKAIADNVEPRIYPVIEQVRLTPGSASRCRSKARIIPTVPMAGRTSGLSMKTAN
jgi:ATP-dependent DNA helicase RecG